MSPYVAIVGNLIEGVEVYGPYPARPQATAAHAEDRKHTNVLALPLREPAGYVAADDRDDGEGTHGVAVGTVPTGFTFFGPFVSWASADEWANRHPETAWVVKLEDARETV